MSRLIFTENGFVMPDLCEELNEYRRAAKELTLPAMASPARLFFLARPHRLDVPPLKVSVNHQPVAALRPQGDIPAFRWYETQIPAQALIAGRNRFAFWSGGGAMDAWTLGVETGYREASSSFLSVDGGKTGTWQNKGRLANLCGEYVARVRLTDGQDAQPPDFLWETPHHPRLEHLRTRIPEEVRRPGSTLEQVHRLASWVAQLWEYRSSAKAAHYAPWDAETIIAWGQARQGQNGQLPIVMCVHYAVVFITCCQALGIKARGAVFTEDVNGFNGHFAAEAWIPEQKKWVFVDPNLDAIFYQHDLPMSIDELRAAGADWTPFARFGPGYAFQIQNPAIVEFMKIYLNGRFARLRGIWPRADFFSHPEATPPAHGCHAYSETSIVWLQNEGLAMFPYQVDEGYFSLPPIN